MHDDTWAPHDATHAHEVEEIQKRRAAVALSYAALEDAVPKVTAKGHRSTAERILALAREAGVPVTESPELTRALMQVELDREIPPALYAAVAEILVWIWKLQHGKAG